MKKFIKIIALPFLAMILVACSNNGDEEPVESAPAETTEQAPEETVETEETTENGEQTEETETTETTEDGEAAEDDTEADDGTAAEDTEAETEATEEASEDAVAFTFIVSGEETPIAEFAVEDAEGLSVLEAMESIEGLEFTFNEVEGVIDVIEGFENDYEVGNTWTYVINGEYAQLGVVSQTLQPGDTIDWYYGTIDEIPINIVIE